MREIDASIFREDSMGLRDALLNRPLHERMSYDAARNALFLDFEGLRLRSTADIDALGDAVCWPAASCGRPSSRSLRSMAGGRPSRRQRFARRLALCGVERQHMAVLQWLAMAVRCLMEQRQAMATMQPSPAPTPAADELTFDDVPFRGIVEQSLAGVYVVLDERFMYANDTFAAMFGYSRDE
ncbi:MAG TPA: PAS domain-containing protein, partial [Albitalea sp.]|nr:PAS domain-containing protein [Albitalea sp.]